MEKYGMEDDGYLNENKINTIEIFNLWIDYVKVREQKIILIN